MNRPKQTTRRLLLTLLAAWIFVPVFAQTSETDILDEEIRFNPDIDIPAVDDDDYDDTDVFPRIPPFVSSVPIDMNGADWEPLRRKLMLPSRRFSIVHIGDSHLQADIATQQVRDWLQYDFGNGGRGLVAPLKISGTNEPFNYAFTSNIPWKTERFMKHPWTREMGFTGCSLYNSAPNGYIELSTSDKLDYNPFCIIQLYHKGPMNITSITDEEGSPLGFAFNPNTNGTQLILSAPTRKARIEIRNSSGEPVTLFGASLESNRPGLTYNVIGNNGATYSSYDRIDGFAKGVAALSPDLIILSLGCNEAFGGSFNSLTFITQMDNLVRELRAANPAARFLLVTPIECDRRARTTRRSRKRRRKTTTTSFSVNQNILPVREAIVSYGRKNHIPVYDFYKAAGGAGAAARWVANGLYSKDHIHLSGDGYRLQGRMLYEALATELKPSAIVIPNKP
ncbi:MAG: GDSL-type esterase/lipase family protein [Clostridium sp.]|nr:GDSL-type esterase/lipase family protein [Clostridium sp.]